MSKFFNKTAPVTDFTKLRGRIIAPSKYGKTSLVESINRYFHPTTDTIALFSIAEEDGGNAIEVSDERVLNWEELVEVVDDIVENAETYKEEGVKMFAFDTEDAMVDISDDESIKTYNKERDTAKQKKAKTINGAFGGYQRGQKHSVKSIIGQLSRVYNAGFGTLTFGHAKQKEITDKIADIVYEQTTSDLVSTYSSKFDAYSDFIVIGYFDYVQDEDSGKMTEVKRVLSLHPKDPSSVGSGARFFGLPEKLEWETYAEDATPKEQYQTNLRNGAKFMDIFVEALKVNSEVRGIVSTPDVKVTVVKEVKAGKKVTSGEIEVDELLEGEALVNALRSAGKKDKSVFAGMIEIIGIDDLKEVAAKITRNDIDKIAVEDLNDLLQKE